MDIIAIIFFLAVGLFLRVLIPKTKKNDHDEFGYNRYDEIWPFYAKKLLSQPEQILYFRLVEALPNHLVLAQVQLSRLLGVKKGNNYQVWSNRINRMSADFVICKKDSSIIAVIELDDASHLEQSRVEADAKKDKALGCAEIRIIRWQAKSIPDKSTIRTTFNLAP
jgi:very-short-patch-repair endonuclease